MTNYSTNSSIIYRFISLVIIKRWLQNGSWKHNFIIRSIIVGIHRLWRHQPLGFIHWLVQLVYVAWMPERPKDNAVDLLSGRLDGIIWRVTLAPDGERVLYDTIHPCGCFHMFFPTPRVEPLPKPQRYVEWAFSPATLPAIPQGSRLIVSARTRSHYLRNVWPAESADGSEYAFADYDVLRTLPLPGGGSRSAFGPDGLVPGTGRGERYFFWPMGIASAGAMRQWGTHATAFLGRRHFDDADLIEQRFRLVY